MSSLEDLLELSKVTATLGERLRIGNRLQELYVEYFKTDPAVATFINEFIRELTEA
jgi:hypothetical protein